MTAQFYGCLGLWLLRRWDRSVDEDDFSGIHVIDSTDQNQITILFHHFEDRAVFSDVRDGHQNISFDHFAQEFRVLACFLSGVIFETRNCRFDAGQHLGDIAEFDAINRRSHGSAVVMAEDDGDLGSGNLAGEFHAAEDIGVGKITGNSGNEEVANATIKNIFHWHAGVDAREHYCFGELAFNGRPDLLGMVTLCQRTCRVTRVARFKKIQDFLWGQCLLFLTRHDTFLAWQ